jgi:hypothetical protein
MIASSISRHILKQTSSSRRQLLTRISSSLYGNRNSHSYRDFAWNSAEVDIEDAQCPPTSWYTEEKFLREVEKEHTFKNWICIGRTDQLKHENDYIAKTILEDPIVVVNIGDGKLAGIEMYIF